MDLHRFIGKLSKRLKLNTVRDFTKKPGMKDKYEADYLNYFNNRRFVLNCWRIKHITIILYVIRCRKYFRVYLYNSDI